MDLFRNQADAILEVARFGHSENLTVLLHHHGDGLPPRLHLIMGEGAGYLPPQSAATAAYRVTRGRGECGREEVLVRGYQGTRSCELSGAVAHMAPAPFLLNNQALYDLAPACALPPGA